MNTGSKCHLWSIRSSFYVLFTFLLLLPAQLGYILKAYIFIIIPASLGFKFSTHPEADLILLLNAQAKGTSMFVVFSLLKPVQFNPGNCPLLAVDGIAYGYQQLVGAAPGAWFQGVIKQGQSLQLQLLGLTHLFHHAFLTTPWEELPITNAERIIYHRQHNRMHSV